jgi:hypothetical protein
MVTLFLYLVGILRCANMFYCKLASMCKADFVLGYTFNSFSSLIYFRTGVGDLTCEDTP